ncbi:MAG: hypothetical protein GY757_54755 [bacterium]|nr:hypothetical protein [bacterium]
MKRLNAFLLVILLLVPGSVTVCMGNANEPVILKAPTDWRFERMDFPISFAPELKYTGFEELRFAPGMFENKSPGYFSYIFVIVLENTAPGDVELTDFLLKYYKGLCSLVARQKKMAIDLSKFSVKVEKLENKASETSLYACKLAIIDPFTDGRELELNMEIRLVAQKSPLKLALVAIASPKAKDSKIWKKLCNIRERLDLKKF